MAVLYKILKRLYKNQGGAAFVIIAFAMAALIGFTALVTDIGLITVNRQKMVNLTDAAALSGCQELPDEALAVQEAMDYAGLNNFDPAQLTYDVSEDKTSITVSGSKNVNMAFAKILGLYSKTVSASATAEIQSLTAYTGIAPLTIKESKIAGLNTGDEIEIKTGDPEVGPGNFGPLSIGLDYDYDGNDLGAMAYKYNLIHGCPTTIKVDDVLLLKPGNMTGPTHQGVSELLAGDTSTFENHTPDCKRIIIVPIYKDVPYKDLNGRSCVTVVGFTSLFITRHHGANIYGKFIETLKEGEVSPTQYYYGVGKPTLIS